MRQTALLLVFTHQESSPQLPDSPRGHSCTRCRLGGSLYTGQFWPSWWLFEKPSLLLAHWSALPLSPFFLLLLICLPVFPFPFPPLSPSLLLQQAVDEKNEAYTKVGQFAENNTLKGKS